MAITAGMVKELRELTGVGMLDCKKALMEVDGDMDKAVEYLREKVSQLQLKKLAVSQQRALLSLLFQTTTKQVLLLKLTQRQTSLLKTPFSRSMLLRLLTIS